jgi:hypothetical protein
MTREDLQWAGQHAGDFNLSTQEDLKQEAPKPKPHHKYKAAGLLKKLAKPELSKEDRERIESKLNAIKTKMTPEDLQWAGQHAVEANPSGQEPEKRMPQYQYKARKVLKKLMTETDLSPDDKQALETKLEELKSKMTPDALTWLDEKATEYQEKLKKLEKKRNKALKQHITNMIQESASDIANLITKGGEKQRGCKKLIDEFSKAFSSLPEEKQKEIDALLQGTPMKLVAFDAEKKQKREERAKSRKMRSKSRSKSQSKSPEERFLKRKHFGKRKSASKEKADKCDAPKIEESKKYRPFVVKKAKYLKEMFQEADYEALLEFVEVNHSMKVDELVECYLASKK